MNRIFLLLFLFSARFVFAAGGDERIVCGELKQPVPVKYCVHQPSSAGSADCVYHLHASGGSELSWQEEWYYPAQIREEWKRSGVSRPTVISLSFGPVWILAEKNSSPESGLLEAFTTAVMPELDRMFCSSQGKRILVGESMGGFNAVQLALKTRLFQKAAILCSPMSEASPFASKEVIEAAVEKTAAWHYYKNDEPDTVWNSVVEVIRLAKKFFPNEVDWQTASPWALAERADPKTAPVLYVSSGFYDRFAAYEANQIFADRLKSRGFQVEWRPQWGGHCAMDIPSLARFLAL